MVSIVIYKNKLKGQHKNTMRIGFLFLFLAYVAWTQTFNFEQWETKSHLIQSIFIKSDLSSVMNKNFLLKKIKRILEFRKSVGFDQIQNPRSN